MRKIMQSKQSQLRSSTRTGIFRKMFLRKSPRSQNSRPTLTSMHAWKHFASDGCYYFVFDYCDGETIEYVMLREGRIPEFKVLIFLRQIIEAFKILKKHNIIHRKLRPSKILLHNGLIKLQDFGFDQVQLKEYKSAKRIVGESAHVAPDILRNIQYH